MDGVDLSRTCARHVGDGYPLGRAKRWPITRRKRLLKFSSSHRRLVRVHRYTSMYTAHLVATTMSEFNGDVSSTCSRKLLERDLYDLYPLV